jgi:hypothetical protein
MAHQQRGRYARKLVIYTGKETIGTGHFVTGIPISSR